MRRTLAALTTSAVLIPLAITAMPGAASAATNPLTVHVYGRDGAKVSTSVHATNLNTREAYTLTSNRAKETTQGHLRRRRRNRRKRRHDGSRRPYCQGLRIELDRHRRSQGEAVPGLAQPAHCGDPRRSHGAHLRRKRLPRRVSRHPGQALRDPERFGEFPARLRRRLDGHPPVGNVHRGPGPLRRARQHDRAAEQLPQDGATFQPCSGHPPRAVAGPW